MSNLCFPVVPTPVRRLTSPGERTTAVTSGHGAAKGEPEEWIPHRSARTATYLGGLAQHSRQVGGSPLVGALTGGTQPSSPPQHHPGGRSLTIGARSATPCGVTAPSEALHNAAIGPTQSTIGLRHHTSEANLSQQASAGISTTSL